MRIPDCSRAGCTVVASDPSFPQTVLTIHSQECDTYKFFTPKDPRCTCIDHGSKGPFHLIYCDVFKTSADDTEF